MCILFFRIIAKRERDRLEMKWRTERALLDTHTRAHTQEEKTRRPVFLSLSLLCMQLEMDKGPHSRLSPAALSHYASLSRLRSDRASASSKERILYIPKGGGERESVCIDFKSPKGSFSLEDFACRCSFCLYTMYFVTNIECFLLFFFVVVILPNNFF